MKSNNSLEDIFNELNLIRRKLEGFTNCKLIKLNKSDMLFLELIDKRSWEVSGIAGEIERRVQGKT